MSTAIAGQEHILGLPVLTLPALRSARAARRPDEVIRIASAMVARKDNTIARRVLARTLSELSRHAEAAPHWTALHEEQHHDPEAAFQVASQAMRTGESFDRAVVAAAAGNSAVFAANLRRVLTEPLPSADDGLRHIAICGVSFCGSTLLDRLLGGLAGARSIGESHWLTKQHDGANYVALDVGGGSKLLRPACSVCGHRCAVLTPDFRIALAFDPSRWYFRIARRLGTATLISADKNLPKLVELDPLLRFSALVIFKSPEQAWASQRAKLPRDRDGAFYAGELEKYLAVWTGAYRGFLDGFAPAGDRLFVFFDAFTRAPAAVLAAACGRLGLAFDGRVLARTEPGHAIGGNSRAMERLRSMEYSVRVERLGPACLSSAEQETIRTDPAVRHCFRDLMRRFFAWAPAECPRPRSLAISEPGTA